ncbi:MAG: hypothetical protein MHM6MM_001082 [Cercozoa sp. M6MM]
MRRQTQQLVRRVRARARHRRAFVTQTTLPSFLRGLVNARTLSSAFESNEVSLPTTMREDDDGNPIGHAIYANDMESATRVAELLMQAAREDPTRVFAVDTETVDVNPRNESPVTNGRVVALTVYAGPDLERYFGSGCTHIFVDNLTELEQPLPRFDEHGRQIRDPRYGEVGKADEPLQALRAFLESNRVPKVWHNLSFDRHVLYRHGIDVAVGLPEQPDGLESPLDTETVSGFAGDTMHMARIYDTGRSAHPLLPKDQQGYSLAALSSSFGIPAKTAMIKRFGTAAGKQKVPPNADKLMLDPSTRGAFVDYACYDAEATWKVFQILRTLLREKPWKDDVIPFVRSRYVSTKFAERFNDNFFTDPNPPENQLEQEKLDPKLNMWQCYLKMWRPLAAVLTQMERFGMPVNEEKVRQKHERARVELEHLTQSIRNQIYQNKDILFDEPILGLNGEPIDPGEVFNPGSTKQMAQLLFAPRNSEQRETLLSQPVYKKHLADNPKAEPWPECTRAFEFKRELTEEEKQKLGKSRKFYTVKFKLRGALGLVPDTLTPTGIPSISTATLLKFGTKLIYLCVGCYSSTAKEGELEKAALKEDRGSPRFKEKIEVMRSILRDIARMAKLQKIHGTFVEPTLDYIRADGRVHSSLGLHTETGRLSSSTPNMQNQPAMDTDLLSVREIYEALPGTRLIVADYGQLELRILAEMASCKTMLDAFEIGGDFHSRTAVTMSEEMKQEVARGELLIEPDETKPDVPLVKDKYKEERKRAKIVNFSAAYGKTAHGFMKDFGTTLKAAKKTLDSWYSERREVKIWQDRQRANARMLHYVRTLLGRTRELPMLMSEGRPSPRFYSSAMRMAINAPVQGGAADIVTCAMVRLQWHKRFRELGWRQLLQVHDEIICEGPGETAEEAAEIVRECMEHPVDKSLLPYGRPFKVQLPVDLEIVDNWMQAK